METILAYPARNSNWSSRTIPIPANLDRPWLISPRIQDWSMPIPLRRFPPSITSMPPWHWQKGCTSCLIGDDDCVCPNLFELAEWANSRGVDSICPKVFIDYYWPNALGEGSRGYLTIPYASKKIYSFDPRSALAPLLKDGITDYMRFHLPKVYHGLVKREWLERIRATTGHHFGGLSPDIYSAVALSWLVKTHLVIDFPISISGACSVSTTAAGQMGAHSGRLEDAPHLRDRGRYLWDPAIPSVLFGSDDLGRIGDEGHQGNEPAPDFGRIQPGPTAGQKHLGLTPPLAAIPRNGPEGKSGMYSPATVSLACGPPWTWPRFLCPYTIQNS